MLREMILEDTLGIFERLGFNVKCIFQEIEMSYFFFALRTLLFLSLQT